MKYKPTDILPLKGYGELLFGESIDLIIQKTGEADQMDQIEGAEAGSMVLSYNQPEMALFFEGYGTSILAYIETRDKEALLFGKQIFLLNKSAIINLMAVGGYDEYVIDYEDGNQVLTYDIAMIDFYFDKDQLLAVSWGVLLDERGEVLNI
ncbi:MAG: hypothetical protein PHG67_11275 [Bacteroidales bacterium]|nr:hypothetical protein [Bacteroidales bacterium]HOI32712.1 hypothetical protein [Bacteroidales bacterium]